MKNLKINLFFFIAVLGISLFTSCSKENVAIDRTLEEVKMLIQNDDLTKVYQQNRQDGMLSLVNQNITDIGEFRESLKVANQETALAYYQEVVNKYVELAPLSSEQRIEIIYDIRYEDLEDELNNLEGQIQRRSDTCDDLLDLAANASDVEIIAYSVGLTGVGNLLSAIVDLALAAYVQNCT